MTRAGGQTDISTLNDHSASEILNSVRSGTLKRTEVMEAALDRIGAVNPRINAIVSMRPREDLFRQAHAADRNPSGGLLDGLPFAIKDLQDTAGIVSSQGSPIFANHVPDADSLLVQRIRKAGAILIGKTNTPEFGLGSHSYNPVHGVTRNPYDMSRSAGGSSGGAAAALAARMVWLADGSDMMGSLRNPAAFCNVIGYRPSFGLVPADPSGEMFWAQLSTDGPMARSVADLALLMDVLAGPHPGFAQSLPEMRPFCTTLDQTPKAKRIGWLGDWAGYYPTEPGIIDMIGSAFSEFDAMGIRVEPVTPAFDPALLWDSWTILRAFLVGGGLKVHADIPADRVRLKPEVLDEIALVERLGAAEIHRAMVIRSDWYRAVSSLFARYDALILPAAQVFPFAAELDWPKQINGRTMDRYHRWMEIVIPASLLGLPTMALPAGFSPAGLPMGFQLIGPPGTDHEVLRLAHAYDQRTQWPLRHPPRG